MKEPYRLKALTIAHFRLKKAERFGDERAIAAAAARVAFHQGMVPQRGSHPAVWRAWHRESGVAGFQNRHERARAEHHPMSALGTWIESFFGVAVENAISGPAA